MTAPGLNSSTQSATVGSPPGYDRPPSAGADWHIGFAQEQDGSPRSGAQSAEDTPSELASRATRNKNVHPGPRERREGRLSDLAFADRDTLLFVMSAQQRLEQPDVSGARA